MFACLLVFSLPLSMYDILLSRPITVFICTIIKTLKCN